MASSAHQPRVIAVGTVTVDVVRRMADDNTCQEVELSFGGVCNNLVCALGALGVRPRFLSPRFIGDLESAVAGHFASNRVEWVRLACDAPLAVFQADLDNAGHIMSEQFVDNGSMSRLTP